MEPDFRTSGKQTSGDVSSMSLVIPGHAYPVFSTGVSEEGTSLAWVILLSLECLFQPNTWMQYYNYSDIIYSPAVGFTKLSILFLVLRVFCPQRRDPFYWVLQTLNILNTIFYTLWIFIAIFLCSPREKIWMSDTQGGCAMKSWVEISVADQMNRQMFADLRVVHLLYGVQHCVRYCNVHDTALEDLASANV